MSHQVAPQHPAVVLRSHYRQLRALLAIAMIAVVGLTATVVILATDEADKAASPAGAQSALTPVEKRWSDYTKAINAMSLKEQAAAFGTARVAPGTRYDGGPEEGTRGAVTTQPQGSRYDGGPEEGTRGPGFGAVSP